MSADHDDADRPDSLNAAKRIHQICLDFEDYLRAGEELNWRRFLEQVEDHERPELIAELLSIANEHPDILPDQAELVREFPDCEEAIDNHFNSAAEHSEWPSLDTVEFAFNGAQSPSPALKSQVFGDFQLLEQIGKGGMGVIYKARQRSLNRIVALKMIRTGALASNQEIQRFYAEAEAAAKLDHPNIVPLYEAGMHDGHHFFAMAFVDGLDLAEKTRDTLLTPQQTAEYVKVVCEAIHFAHEHDVLHRDIKPGNILIDESGNIRITDFGLAKNLESNAELTHESQILGTPEYMSPEQAQGRHEYVCLFSDVYSIGALFYTLLTGRPPFRADNWMATLTQVVEREPVAPRHLNPRIDIDIETICLKCLEKAPLQRYASAQEVADELARYLAGESIHARPVSRPTRAFRWCKRNPMVSTLVLLVACSLILGTTISTYFAVSASKTAGSLRVSNDSLKTLNAELISANDRITRTRSDAQRFANLAISGSEYSDQQNRMLHAVIEDIKADFPYRQPNNTEVRHNSLSNTLSQLKNESQRLRKLTDTSYQKMLSHTYLGLLFLSIAELDKSVLPNAVEELRAALSICDEIQPHVDDKADSISLKNRQLDIRRQMAKAWTRAGQPTRALEELNLAMNLASQLTVTHPEGQNFYIVRIDILLEMASANRSIENYEKAIRNLKEAIDLESQYNTTSMAQHYDWIVEERDLMLARCYYDISICQLALGDLDKAEDAARQAIQLLSESPQAKKDPLYGERLATAYLRMGAVHFARQDWDSAFSVLEMGVKELESELPKSPRGVQVATLLAQACYHLGRVSMNLRKWNEATRAFSRSASLFAQLGEWEKVRVVDLELARLTQELQNAGDLERAAITCETLERIRADYAANSPNDFEAKASHLMALDRLRGVLANLGRKEQMRNTLTAGLNLAIEIGNNDVSNDRAQRELALFYYLAALNEIQLEQYENAPSLIASGMSVLERLDSVARDPEFVRQWRPKFEAIRLEANDAIRAIVDPDYALNGPPDRLDKLVPIRAKALTNMNQHEALAKLAASLQTVANGDASRLHDSARFYSRAAAIVARENNDSNITHKDSYLEQAVVALDAAIDAGWNDIDRTQTELDFDLLRHQTDFQALMKRMTNAESR